MFTRSKTQKKYFNDLKSDILECSTKIKKRYDLFPWSKLHKACRSSLIEDKVLSVKGKKFTPKELSKELTNIKDDLKNKSKNSSYNSILRSFTKDCVNRKDQEIKSIYTRFKKEIDKSYKEGFNELQFCLEALKVLNIGLKEEKALIDYYDEFTRLYNEGAVMEGVNVDYVKILHGSVAKQRQLTKEFTSLVKAENYSEAHKKITELKLNIKNSIHAIMSVPESSITEHFVGLAANTARHIGKSIPMLFVPVVGADLAIGVAGISMTKEMINLHSAKNKYKLDKKYDNYEYSGTPVRDAAIAKLYECDKKIDKLNQKLKEKESGKLDNKTKEKRKE